MRRSSLLLHQLAKAGLFSESELFGGVSTSAAVVAGEIPELVRSPVQISEWYPWAIV